MAITRYFNNSRLVLWQDCRRKYALSNVLRLEPKVLSNALAFGSAGHEWLGTYYLDGSLAQQHEAFEQTYRKLGNPLNMDEFEPHLDMGHRLIDAYAVRNYILDDFAVVQVESQFVVPIGSKCSNCGTNYTWRPDHTVQLPVCERCYLPIFWLVGRADLIVTRKDRLVVIDHKTAKGVSKNTMDAWGHDFGMIGYCYGVERTTGLRVAKFGMNVIKKLKTVGKVTKVCPDCRNGKRKRLTCDACERTGLVYMEPPQAFYRDYANVTQQDYDSLIDNRIRLCKEIVQEEVNFASDPVHAYPMNCKTCHKYGEKGPCPYIDLCWNRKPGEPWWEPAPNLLAEFDTKPEDYVDAMVREEFE